uniref:protein-histidine N-methyltransferase n=1 Tax=Strigamia maritima TaxID=126957 RepID=T1J8C9_STRMM
MSHRSLQYGCARNVLAITHMAFKFNFDVPGDSLQEDERTDEVEQPIKAIKINDKHYEIAKECSPVTIKFSDGTQLLTVRPSDAEKKCRNSTTICEAIRSHSDLIAGKYEGGLKIWEGSVDLCQYLITNKVQFHSKSVLELGCGAGLPGLYALKKGASCVHFQDFNFDVLETMTTPNTILNTSIEHHPSLANKCKFYAGDWLSFLNHLTKRRKEETKYDIILTSETIYNPQYHKHLYNLMRSVIKPDGVAWIRYLAAKAYYFGLGGGIQQFTQMVRQDGFFDSRTVWSTDEGLERNIIQFRPKLI